MLNTAKIVLKMFKSLQFVSKSGAALMHDMVKIFTSSLRDFSNDAEIEVPALDCKEPSKWEQGEMILKILDQVCNHYIVME